MKNYITLFEKFEEAFDDFYQAPNTKSDNFYHMISKELIDLADQYMTRPTKINAESGRYGTASRIKDLQNDLIAEVNDSMGEEVAEEFAMASDNLLKSYSTMEKKAEDEMTRGKMFKKSKIDLSDNLADQPKDNAVYSKPGKQIRPNSGRTRSGGSV